MSSPVAIYSDSAKSVRGGKVESAKAAQSMGFRRVMLPDKQKLEAKDYPSKIIRVGDVTQALATVF